MLVLMGYVILASVALSYGLRWLGTTRRAERRIQVITGWGFIIGPASGPVMLLFADDLRAVFNATCYVTAACITLFFFGTSLWCGAFHLLDFGRQRRTLESLVAADATAEDLPEAQVLRLEDATALEHAMDRVTDKVNVRIFPAGEHPEEAALVCEDWSELSLPDRTHFIIPAGARIRREHAASGAVALTPTNPFRALVVRPGPEGLLVIAAADTPFTHRVLEILRAG